VEDLQLNRNVPVHLLDELVRLTPEGIYLGGIKQTDSSVLVNGVAQTNERVSEFLRNAQSNSPWFDRMELLEIKAVTQPPVAGSREQRRLFEFALRVSLKQPGAPASAPAGAGSAPKPA
jgi:type IV pilus assembly protein PilN